jgi:rubrerythrin
MLQIRLEHIEAARNAGRAEDLQQLLQNAIELEHSTIPPYLTAAYSLQPGTNTPIRRLITSIAKEEMLHMAIAANVLNAIGGKPQIDDPGFIPRYPGPLPMGVGGLTVGLRKFSEDLVHDTFMQIEEPESPISFPTAFLEAPLATIGEFYRAIIDKIHELGDGIFTGDAARQVTGDIGLGVPLSAITNADTATSALTQIVVGGEGTSTSPLGQGGKPAHYYRFASIYVGRMLIADASAPNGYSYTGAALPFDPAKVFDLPDDPHAADYPAGTPERAAVDGFNRAYSDVLRMLQRGFDGEPARITDASLQMSQLRQLADGVVAQTDPRTGKALGLTFEYL